MRITLTGVHVQDQAKALAFYTEKLGFVKNKDVDLGQFRWLTLVSPEGPAQIELLLEPDAHPAAKAYQAALYADGIPAHSFEVDNLDEEVARLKAAGVSFRKETTDVGEVLIAVLDDTCGNFIQLMQLK